MAKYIVQIVVAGVQVVGRAFSRALRQEFQASNAAASRHKTNRDGRKQAATDAYTGLSLDEAMKILNISDFKDAEKVQRNHDHLLGVNEKKKGGSFYILSKVVRAKERIDAENTTDGMNSDQQDTRTEDTTKKSDENT